VLKITMQYDNRVEVNAKHFKIVIDENAEGIVVDVYGENALITTNTYWDIDEQPEPELIRVKDLTVTCSACPSQWTATEVDTLKPVYVRYRWGRLTVQIGQNIVYSELVGDNMDGVMSTKEMKARTNIVEEEND